MITNDQLQAFCSTDDSRTPLRQPFNRPDGYTYATNGQVMVRVPALLPVSLHGDVGAERVFTMHPRTDRLLTLPDPLPEDEVCKACDGCGQHDCPHCGQDMACHSCHGTGRIPATVVLAGRSYLVRNLRPLVGLPNLQLFAPDEEHGSIHAATFTFDGGEGLVSPRK